MKPQRNKTYFISDSYDDILFSDYDGENLKLLNISTMDIPDNHDYFPVHFNSKDEALEYIQEIYQDDIYKKLSVLKNLSVIEMSTTKVFHTFKSKELDNQKMFNLMDEFEEYLNQKDIKNKRNSKEPRYNNQQIQNLFEIFIDFHSTINSFK